jgi:hypothetical protein
MNAYNGEDNRVAMSSRSAAAWLKSGLHQAVDAFAELEDKGFVRCYERGGFVRKVRHATTWTLTMFGRNGQKATLDFLAWQESDSKTRVPRRQQYGCRGGNNRLPTVAREATVSVNHGCQGGNNIVAEEATLIDLPWECARQNGRPSESDTSENQQAAVPRPGCQLSYRGKPTKAARTLELMADGKTWQRSDIVAGLNAHPVEVNQVLRRLCSLDHVQRIGHGRYRLKAGKIPPEKTGCGADEAAVRAVAEAGMPTNVTERLRAAIQRFGWTQKELARRAGTHPPIVSQITRGVLARVGRDTARRVVEIAERGP